MIIPDPEYVTEIVSGAAYELPGGMVLVAGTLSAENAALLANFTPLLAGELTLRYAIATLVPPGDFVVPGLFAGENGGMLVGREAWDYVQSHFQLHPRADIVGIRMNGQPSQNFVRELDFGIPVKVLLYKQHTDTYPMATVDAVYRENETIELPELLLKYSPVILTLSPYLSALGEE